MNARKESSGTGETNVKSSGHSVTHYLSTALLIWLFGVLVFIPIADTISAQTKVFVSLIVFISFTILLLKAVPRVKRLLEVFAIVLAKKFKFMKEEDGQIMVFKSFLQIMFIIFVYLFYFPFLNNFHPAINGIVLIVVLLWCFFLFFRILQIIL